ncbi:hypothetical protein FBEOM_12284 [Fusarium beomiforme]|uniref:DUF6603 domain-containing protein n=1 Tax=Fusarium beomiforme TaxID=44412 RepID=A0A9P5A7V7_9HYPO|nr:hypothetical protein FBEOM_12284 [Fusarium beomiforme]
MSALILHVIYAGRGDAMILECDDYKQPGKRNFILVDGGPKKYGAIGRSREAPYHRYLSSACQRIMEGDSFAGIIFSHPDEDHYAGYLHARQDKSVPFSENLFLPNVSSGTNENAPIDKVCSLAGLDKAVLHPFNYKNQYLIPPVRPIFPQRENILWYHGGTDRDRAHDFQEFDKKVEPNGRSILMYTVTLDSVGEMGIFFTGDNNANTISRCMSSTPPLNFIPNFAIYKIQHHGALKDNMKDLYEPKFSDDITAIGLLYFLFKVREGCAYLPYSKKVTAAVKHAANHFYTQTKFPANRRLLYYERLEDEVKRIQAEILTNLNAPIERAKHRIYLRLGAHPDLWAARKYLEELDEVLSNLKLTKSFGWGWKTFRNGHSTVDFKTYLHVCCVKKFYLTFTADVYVVSANDRHSHPKSEVLVGLALAVREQQRKARLYVTNGRSVDVLELALVAEVLGQGSVDELFYGEHLRISYLSRGTYMSLNGESRAINQAPITERDMDGTTDEIKIQSTGAQEKIRNGLHVWLEQNDNEDIFMTQKYWLKTFVNGFWCYLHLQPVNTGIDWCFTDQNNPRYIWIDSSSLNIVKKGAFKARCRTEQFSIASRAFQCSWAGFSDGLDFYYIEDILSGKMLHKTTDFIDFTTNDARAPLAAVTIELVPLQFQSEESSDEDATYKDPVHTAAHLGTGLSQHLNFPIGATTFSSEHSLREAFEILDDPIKNKTKPNIIEILSRLLRDKDALASAIERLPEALLKAAFVDFELGLDQSTVTIDSHPLLGKVIGSAVLERGKPQEGKKCSVEIEMAGFEFSLMDIVVKVDKCCSPQVYLAVESKAIMQKTGLQFKMAWKSTEKETTISFSSSVVSIRDLIFALANTEVDAEKILQGNIPLMKKPPASHSTRSVGDMKPGLVPEIGFSLSQPIGLINKYDLAEVWIRTEFPDWKSFMPTPDKFEKVRGEVLIRILDPLHPATTRIGTSVQLSMPLPSNEKQFITAQFDATPLARVGDYDYRFQITSATYGVTVPDIFKAMGLDHVSDIVKNMPVLERVFDAVQVNEAGFSVVKANDKWEFREWDLGLFIPFFDLFPGSLSLVDTVIHVECYGKEDIQAKGEATFRSETLQKEANISLGLPSKDELGFIIFSSPDALNLADVFAIFGLGDLPTIPFLTGNYAVEVSYCDAKFKKSEDGKLLTYSSTSKFKVPNLEVEQFKLEDIEFSIAWQQSGDEKPESSTSFELSGLLQTIESFIEVRYDGGKKELTASINPIQGSPIKVVDVLSFLIRGFDSALHAAFGNLEVKFVEMSLDVSTGSLSSFKLEFKDDAALSLPSAADNRPFVLNSAHLEYVEAMSKLDVFAALKIGGIPTAISLTSLNSTSGERSVDFSIAFQENQQETSLKALLAAAGIEGVYLPSPEGCPEFNVGMADIKGKFVENDKSKLKFAQLNFHVETAEILKAVEDWDISVNRLYLEVDYDKSKDKPFSAILLGSLTIAQSVEMVITYADTKDGSEFQAHLASMKETEVKIGDIVQWLTGDYSEESLPSFISQSVVDLKSAKFDMSLSRRKQEGKSALTVSLSFVLGSVAVQLARTKIRPENGGKNEKVPWKTLLRLAVNTLPRPPPLPLVGQMEQPFSTQLYWTNSVVSTEEVMNLNTLVTFKSQKLLLSERATGDVAYGQGISFLLLNEGNIILASKSMKTKKREDASGKAFMILEEDSPESQEMKTFDKSVNGVSITNVGFEYNAKDQKIKIKFTARITVGPLDGELINFSMSVKFPQGEKVKLSNWKKLNIDMDLDGLSLAMTGSNLNVAGSLHRIKVEGENMAIAGFEGGVSVKLKTYEFVGFGSFKGVKFNNQEEFVSLMAYAMLSGPILKTPCVEIVSISGGFGFGSKLQLPPITEINNFPLLMSPTHDPLVMFDKLRSNGGQKHMTETNSANWVAAGIRATACETVDISAVLTLPLDPSVSELAIVGTASAQFPRDAKADKALAAIKINFQGNIDVARGFMLFEGRIADGSFLLFQDCKLSGGFAVGAWFGTSPQAGDWCISIGGWHPAYQPPAHYPSTPPRMRLQWSYGDNKELSRDGQAYAAVTPDALMGGLAVSAIYKSGRRGAHFDFRADLILWLHPLHYDTSFFVSAGLSYEMGAGIFTVPMKITLSAKLHISGPPFGGEVVFDWTVAEIEVRFGVQQRGSLKKLSFQEFLDVVQRKSETDHVLSLESGAVAPSKAPNSPQTPNSIWTVRGGSLALSVTSRVPTKKITFSGASDPENEFEGSIFARPMQIPSGSPGVKANMTVSIVKMKEHGEDMVRGFTFEVIREQLPASLWGPFDGDANAMLGGTSRESTLSHVTGLRIQAPESKLSDLNPPITQFSILTESIPLTVPFVTDTERDVGLDAKPRANEPGQDNRKVDLSCATEALHGTSSDVLKAKNGRRSSILKQWADVRNLKSPFGLKASVPLKFAKGLSHFAHVTPRVSLE